MGDYHRASYAQKQAYDRAYSQSQDGPSPGGSTLADAPDTAVRSVILQMERSISLCESVEALHTVLFGPRPADEAPPISPEVGLLPALDDRSRYVRSRVNDAQDAISAILLALQ